ncbi:MAG: MFS transporter, partial [Antricoccus sp.]
MSTEPQQRVSRGVWICFAVGVLSYIVAVFNRSSFGVAGLPAAERFSASASDVAAFAVVQLIVYAALQIPVGIMIDRFGSRRLIIIDGILMTVGQALLALVGSITPALLARVLIGAGDAFTFTCVLRLVSDWFPSRRVPVITQMTGLLGQVGQIMSAIPFAALLAVQPWTFSFLMAAAVTGLSTVIVIVFLKQPP